ncbi:uncharacterized protein LOC101859584 [Aplysia californica]|uniref:Uncharacterized protein LOC101859584 n=1 Tax=Aplysia californica TaxID=6500 RepID=A0ABM1A585_APLCA|nr:uncharacterized protein LOC101859584 [Aplysia californica]
MSRQPGESCYDFWRRLQRICFRWYEVEDVGGIFENLHDLYMREQLEIGCGVRVKSLMKEADNDLNQTFPDFIGQMSNMEEELTNSQCLLLVAGELGAGKSSVVNLLLGHTIMPTSELRCTAAIVEISYGASPKAIITWKDDSSGRSITPIVRQCDSRIEEGNFLRDLETYIIKRDVDTDESPFEKIQLFWPIEMLKVGFSSTSAHVAGSQLHQK